MATIAENLQAIQDIKQDIKIAIENKGVDLTNTPFSEYSTKIDEITTGGGTFVVPDGLKFAESKLYEIPETWDFSNVTDMSSMFWNWVNLEAVPFLNTSKVTNMSHMFWNCGFINTIPHFDTAKVTDMRYMFAECRGLKTIPLLDTSNVWTMERLFYNCWSLEYVPLLNTSKVTNMNTMFWCCYKLTTIPQFDTIKVTDMSYMFYGCESLQSLPTLDTSNVTSIKGIFNSCISLQSTPLLECGKITNADAIFGYSTINTLTDIGGFKDLKISITINFLDRTPNLTTDSLMNVINNLYDLTANGLSGQSLRFGQTNLDKLSDEQIAVATAKGWTLTA